MKPFTISKGTMHHAHNILVRVHTQEGFTGYGECSPFPSIVGETQETGLAIGREFAQLWIGRNPLEIRNLMQELNNFCVRNTSIKSAFDMALYDISAQFEGVPLYAFLGGSPKPVRTDITIGIGPLDKMLQEGKSFVAQGAKEIKVKVGTDPELDIERIKSLRTVMGEDVKIRIDANQGWTVDEAKHVLKSIESCHIEFCEQPLHARDDRYLPQLRNLVKIPIMADESCYYSQDVHYLAETDACDFINIKLAKAGGILEAIKIHKAAQSFGIPCMIGGMLESRLALTANLHLAYACEGIQFFDLDSPLLGLEEDPVIGGAVYSNFDLQLDAASGLGATIDPAFLDTCEKWVIQ